MHPNQKISPIPQVLVLTLCMLFAILYGVWLLPHTVFVRNSCLVGGALLSFPIIAKHWRLLFQRAAAPIWLIVLLLVWVTIHLLFIGQDFDRQYLEYTTIWKKIAIGCVFALGFGLAIGQNTNPKTAKTSWAIIYWGLLLPSLIYFGKYILGIVALHYGLTLSPYLILNPDHMGSPFGIARARYVFFCLPAMAVGLGCIANDLKRKTLHWQSAIFYLLSVPLTLTLFELEGDRLGAVYAIALLGVFALVVARNMIDVRRPILTMLALALMVSASVWLVQKVTYQSPLWHQFWADAKMAVQVDKYDAWQTRVLPINELGIPASDSNYMRISWAIVGTRLLMQNPLGYGLLSLSFGGLGKQIWPNAQISWTHSAWLDFALSYGLPALIMIWLAIALTWQEAKALNPPWNTLGRWGLFIAAAVMLTKEVSTEVVLNSMIFMIVWVAALGLSTPNTKPKLPPTPKPTPGQQ